jgi:hypothetical protein
MEDGPLSLKHAASLVGSLGSLLAEQEQPQDSPITTESEAPKKLPSTAWKPGESGNPLGRPLGTRNQLVSVKRKLELAVREGMSAKRLSRIIDKMAKMAEGGDVKAARLILDKFISPAGADDEVAESTNQGITIRIENATFAKTQPQAIDAQFTEIK